MTICIVCVLFRFVLYVSSTCIVVRCVLIDVFSVYFGVFFFKQKTAYEMRISDWSSDVCSSDLELQATRKLLMLDVAEAADLIGQVSPRTWQYWESGRNTVPADVSDEMQALLSIRGEMIDAITEQLPADGSDIELRFHSS